MSRIHPNGYSPWVPHSGSDSVSEQIVPSSQPSTTHKTMNINVDHSTTTGRMASSDRSVWDGNTWDVRRLIELDRSKNWQEQWNPRMSMSFNNTKGLLNAPGDNNCFLNSAVQVLWHLDVFRRSFRMLSGHSCLGSNSCIFCALKVIFTQFQYSDQSCLPPDALRKALAKTFADQQRFQLGLMDDAAECFENILTQIHFHIANGESEDMCNAKHCISHQKFAMTVIEQIVCPCEATSEPFPFSQMVHYVSTSTLVSQAKIANGAATFGQLLKGAISEGDYRNCPSNCGRKVQLRRTLLNSPDVVSVGLVWDSENPTSQHIHDVVWSIGTTLQLKDLFHDVVDVRCKQGSKLYLVGVVCYYGKHYSTFFYHSKMKSWVSFDDANVKEMGSDWSAIVDKCCRGHYQPLLLLYANPDAEVINVETAPQNTVIVKETAFLSNNDENNSGPTGSYHCRQRSCDSLSGTIGGQCVDDSYSESIRLKRSVTPNPDSGKEKVKTVPRRAITPGPEWGHYDSDDDSRTPVVVHQRQSSYLNALDCVDSSERWRAGDKTSMPGQIPAFRRDDMRAVNHASGSKADAASSRSQYHDQIQHQHHDLRSTCGSSGQNEHSQQFVSKSQSCGISAYGSVCSESTITSVAHSSTTYQVAASHSGSGTHYSSALHGTDYPNGPKCASVTHTSHNANCHQSAPTSYYGNGQISVPTSHVPNGQQHLTSAASHPPVYQQSVQNSHYHNGQLPVPTSHYSNGQRPVPSSCNPNGHSIAQSLHYPNGQTSFPVSRHCNGQQSVCTPHYPQGQQCAPTSQHVISQQFAPTSHYSNGLQSVPLAQRSDYASNGQAVPTSHNITDSRQSVPVLAATHKQPQSAPSTPGMKRAQSVENSDSLLVHGPGTRPAVSRSRPSSARPYDYCNSRPTVDPNTGAIIMPSRQQPTLPAVSGTGSEWNEAVLIGDFTTPDSCEPKPASSLNKKSVAGRWNDVASDVGDDVDDGYGMYINPKTVQNVLNIQKSRNVKPSANAGMKMAPVSGIHHHMSELRDQRKQKTSSLHNEALLPDLKVDIPGDNISIGSHKDSGYRSGGSSGDRNSASSASSISFDSPTADNFRGFGGLHWPLTNMHNSSAHSSSESLSSTQSGQTIKNLQNNRLSLIPENQLSSSSSSLTVSGSKSQESLNNSQDYVDGFESDRSLGHSKSSDRWDSQTQKGKDLPCFAGTNVNHGPDAECQKFFLQAEAMLELSAKQEESRDIHAALAYCNQAVSYLQKALSLPGISNDTSVHGRMKHNACVLRSRKLHKQILQQHHPDQSNHQSQSSVPRSSSCDGFLKSDSNKQSSTAAPRKDHTTVQERTPTLYDQPQASSNQNAGYNKHVGGRMVAVSGIAQSRPVQGVTMGHANIPHSVGDSGMSQCNLHHNQDTHQDCHGSSIINTNSLDAKTARYVEIYGTLPKRKGKRSKSPQNTTASGQECEGSKNYGSVVGKQESSATDCSRGIDKTQAVSKMENRGGMGLINHTRQWSKDELRDILLKDFMNRPKASNGQTVSTKQGVMLQRRNSYDPLDNGMPAVSASPAHSRQNSYEDLLSKQMKTVSKMEQYPDLPPKQRNTAQKQAPQLPVQRVTQEESHYDYLPLRSKPSHSVSSGMSSSVAASSSRSSSTSCGIYSFSGPTSVSGMTPTSGMQSRCNSHLHAGSNSGVPSGTGVTSVSGLSANSAGVTIVGITGIPNHNLSTVSPPLRDRQTKQEPESKNEFHDPYSSRRELPTVPKRPTKENIKPSAGKNIDKSKSLHYVKNYEMQRPGEQGKVAVVETVPIKVNKPETPPKPTHKLVKSVKPDVPRRKSSQLSTFKGDSTTPSNPLHTNGPPNPGYEKAGIQSRTGLAPPPYKPPPPVTSVITPECDLPPPPAELLCPPSENDVHSSTDRSHLVMPKTEQHTYVDKPQANGCRGADFENRARSEFEGQIMGHQVDRMQSHATQNVAAPTPTKPSLAKAGGTTKPRKSVTFSENIALIATPEEVPQEIDYVAYVMNLGKKKCLKQNSDNKTSMSSLEDSENFRDDDEEEDDEDDNTSDSMDSDSVLCNLCRKKKIHPPEIYCEHCCFYMSQFQPQAS